ncbi:MAG TPA: hypothetical protein VFS97_09100 [Nitrososphaeraceae archaeon]|nr:hypothetical protein [Nitrososphaeraceae archaeon]
MAIDVFWNPSRLGAGEYTKIGSVNWYGLTYEELVSLIATRFHILNDRIYKTDISFIINLLLTEGQTPFEDILARSYEFYSNRIRRRRQQRSDFRTLSIRNSRAKKLIDINELECVRLLSSLYPTELDFIKTEFTQWMESSYRVTTPALIAAKFLWLCRTNKLPVTLNEISRDFEVRTGNIIHALSDTDYIYPLHTPDYINRISMQLSLPSNLIFG